MSEAVLRKRVADVKECCICLDELTDYKNRVVTNCSHVFCTTCLLIHFREKNECPMCRERLVSTSSNGPAPFEPNLNQQRVMDFARMVRRDAFQTRQRYIDTIISRILGGIYVSLYTYVDNIVPQQQHRRRRSGQNQGQRRCGICRQTGHDRRRCPNRER